MILQELLDTEKEGMFIGAYAVNPMNGEKCPFDSKLRAIELW